MDARTAQIFRDLADLPPDARADYFDQNDVDLDMRREVEDLLAFDSRDPDPFSQTVAASASAYLRTRAEGVCCGPFRLMTVIGRGGMGVVYLAERVDGEVAQRVAVKLLHPGWTELQRERVLQEREILAALSHPNIAHLLDAGRLPDGQPYFAMEYVEGQPIHEHCRTAGIRRKIELVLKVCDAVAYLHANSVLHRDLKPGNILVSARGDVKLLDFGIAKILESSGDPTVTHLRMLTPEYASPEQLSGGPVGTATDIYSLGAVLNHLLTGKPPGPAESDPRTPELKGDLKIIVQTATRHEPGDRYATVEEFAQDLRAWLDSRPIRARHEDRIYRARKMLVRHSAEVRVGGFVMALVAAAAFAWYSSRATSTVHELKLRRITANTPELPVQTAALSRDGAFIAYSDPLGVHVYDTATGATRLLPGTAGHVLRGWSPDGQGVETQTLDDSGAAAATTVSLAGGPPVRIPDNGALQYSPDRARRAAASSDGRRLVVEDADGRHSRELTFAANRVVTGYEWDPDSTTLAIVSAGPGRASTLEKFEAAAGRNSVLIPASRNLYITSIVWPARDRIIVAVWEQGSGINSEGGSNLWEVRLDARTRNHVADFRKLTDWTDFPIRPGSLSTDGRKLAFVRSFRQRDVYVADIATGAHGILTPRRLTLDLGDDYPTAWTRDGKTVILTSDRNGPSAIFGQQIEDPVAQQLVRGPDRQIIARLTPDGKSILFSGRQAGKRGLMRAPVRGGSAELLFETANIADIRCSRAGPCILAEFGPDRSTAVFELDLRNGKGREIYRDAPGRFATPDISPDGRWLAAPASTHIVVRSFATGSVVREIPVRRGHTATHLSSLDYSPDGKGFYVGDIAPTEALLLYVTAAGRASVVCRQAGALPQIWGVPSPDGKHLAVMMYTDDANVYVLDIF